MMENTESMIKQNPEEIENTKLKQHQDHPQK